MKRKSLLIMLLVALFVPLAMNAQTQRLRKNVTRAPRPELQFEVAGQLQTIEEFQPGVIYNRAAVNNRDNVLYSENFDGETLTGISIVDNDGDGNNWGWYGSIGVDGTDALASQSWNSTDGALTPDNWAIFPAVTLPTSGSCFASVYAKNYNANYSETMGIWVAPENDDYIYRLGDDFTLTSGSFVNCEADLSAYAGQTVQVVIRHYNCTDGTYLVIDDFSIYETASTPSPCNSVTFSEVCTNQQNLNGTSISIGNNSSVTFARGTGNNNPVYMSQGTAVRAYWGNTFTITSTSNIVSINLTFGSGDGNNTITTNTGNYSNGAWTGEATSVTFTIGGRNGNRRITAIEVCVEVDHTCDAPTELSSADVTENSAELSWTGFADAYNIQYRVNDPNAPATIILTAGDVWGDGSGYQMLLDADATMYGNVYNNGYLISDYSDFEYSIPVGAQFDPDDSHIVVNNSVSIQIPAGTYDWNIFNPTPGDEVYMAGDGGIGGMADNYVFEAGMTYEFVVSYYNSQVGDGASLTITDNREWTSVPGTVTSPYTLTGLDPETTYEWQVKGDGCNDWSAIASFTTLEETSLPVQFTVNAPETAHPGDVITVEGVLTAPESYEGFTDLALGIYYDATAFQYVANSLVYGPVAEQAQQLNAFITPSTTDNAVLLGINCFNIGSFVTAEGVVFSAQFTVLNGAEGEYTFTAQPNDAGNFDHEGVLIPYEFTPSTVTIAALEQYFKSIGAYGTHGYYLIASPIGEVNPGNVTNMLTPKDGTANTYDLYIFDQAEQLEWRNYRQGAFEVLEPGKGYLYANLNDVVLTFTGLAYTGSGEVTLSKTEADAGDGLDFPDWNLVGNPFAETAYIADGRDFYTMTANGTSFEVSSMPSIEAMEGVFVIAATDGEKMYFTTTEPANTGKSIILNLGEGRQNIDRAIIRFGEGRTLPKLQLFEGSTKIYIPQDGKDYAVVRSEEMGAMPVNFKAENNGTYSLSVSGQNTEFAYLHLIDNKTGKDIDLLQTPSYSFEAKTTDYESRFKLVFATGDNSNDDSFAFFSNGSFVINNEGAAELQVIDLMGRILSSETINGCTNVSVNGAPGIYMLRLINGDNMKVQKVVVK